MTVFTASTAKTPLHRYEGNGEICGSDLYENPERCTYPRIRGSPNGLTKSAFECNQGHEMNEPTWVFTQPKKRTVSLPCNQYATTMKTSMGNANIRTVYIASFLKVSAFRDNLRRVKSKSMYVGDCPSIQ
jgi:hypothetical protein